VADIAADEVPLINNALAMIGSDPIQSLDEDTELNETVQGQWPRARNHCLFVHAWRFCRKTMPLNLLPETPVNGWPYAYALPGGADALEAVLMNPQDPYSTLRDFDLQEDKLYSWLKPLWGRFRFRPAVTLWPALFVNAVETLGAAYFAVPVAHDANLAADYRSQAVGSDREAGKGGILGRAIAEDFAQRPVSSPLLRGDPLTMARYE